jgi:hypothetical protein
VSKQHLDLLAMVTGALEGGCAGQSTGHIASILIQIARYPTPGRVGTAAGLQLTALTVNSAGVVQACTILGDAGAWNGKLATVLHQPLAARTGVVVLVGIKHEVGSGERAVGAVCLVDHRDMWRDLPLLDQPGEVLGRAIGTVCRQMLRVEGEALASALATSP